jgi:hypothetical protein
VAEIKISFLVICSLQVVTKRERELKAGMQRDVFLFAVGYDV